MKNLLSKIKAWHFLLLLGVILFAVYVDKFPTSFAGVVFGLMMLLSLGVGSLFLIVKGSSPQKIIGLVALMLLLLLLFVVWWGSQFY